MGSLRASRGRLGNQPPGVFGRPLLLLRGCRAGHPCYRAISQLAAPGSRGRRSPRGFGSLRNWAPIRGTHAPRDRSASHLGPRLAPRGIPSGDLAGGNHHWGVPGDGRSLGNHPALANFKAQEGAIPMWIIWLTLGAFAAGYMTSYSGLITWLSNKLPRLNK